MNDTDSILQESERQNVPSPGRQSGGRTTSHFVMPLEQRGGIECITYSFLKLLILNEELGDNAHYLFYNGSN